MTSPTPMIREELFELAALDAYGLLDDYETALFTRSFHHSSATVQQEIRELQASIASDPVLLPEVEPHESLRQKVLESVASRIETESAKLAPLATIGSMRAQETQSNGRVALGPSGQFWRAASFVLAASMLVVVSFCVKFYQDNNRLMDVAIDAYTNNEVEKFAGPGFRDIAHDPTATRVDLDSLAGVDGQFAVVYVNEETSESFLFTLGLPANDQYTLIASNEDGDVEFSRSFRTRDVVGGVDLGAMTTTLVASLATITWQITDSSGAIVCQSA